MDYMSQMRIFCLGLMANLALAPLSWGQAPAIPGAPAGTAAPTAAPAAPGGNLWSFFCPTADQKAACKNCFCNSAIGKLVSGGGGPMAMMSGGLIPNRCAQNSVANDLQKSAESPEGAAAKVKADEAEAKARAAAVRFLANVDCERWPEATETLKNALRKDRNECVRLEAALALRNGCCCNNETIDALKNCVLGENKTDPAPVERSERVRAVAAEALARCVMTQPVEDPREKVQKTEAAPTPDPADYYKKIASMPRDQVVAGARAALVSVQKPVKAQTASQGAGSATPAAPGSATPASALPVVALNAQYANNLSGIFANAFAPGGTQTRPPFFSSLTKTLTGKQDYPAPALAPARHEPAPPTPGDSIRLPDPAVIPAEIPPAAPPSVSPPRQLPEIKPVLPRVTMPPAITSDSTLEWLRESKATPMQIIQFRPSSDFRLGAPIEVRHGVLVEILQPVLPAESTASGPRELRGILTIEDAPAAPDR
jgi:hypothetical protein